MVSCPVDGEGGAAQFADDAAHVGQQGCFQFCVNGWTAIFGAKNNVGQQVGKCVGHVLSPLRGWKRYLPLFPHGWCRGLWVYRP
jgi:hypothetical protein